MSPLSASEPIPKDWKLDPVQHIKCGASVIVRRHAWDWVGLHLEAELLSLQTLGSEEDELSPFKRRTARSLQADLIQA